MFGRFGEVFISYLACCDKLRKMRLLMWRCCSRARLGTPITCWSGLHAGQGLASPGSCRGQRLVWEGPQQIVGMSCPEEQHLPSAALLGPFVALSLL